MKKLILLAAVALVTAIVPSLAGAVGNDVKGPACADIIGGDVFYPSSAGARLDLAAPSCAYVTYTLVVLDEEGGQELTRIEESGDGTAQILLSGQSTDNDSTICVYVETSVGGGKHVFDRAKDTGCITLELGGSPPGLGDFS